MELDSFNQQQVYDDDNIVARIYKLAICENISNQHSMKNLNYALNVVTERLDQISCVVSSSKR
jgi:hypothetical protein